MSAKQERMQLIMQLLVEHYIEDGNPVSSKSLANQNAVNSSPATVRNIMMALEQQGLIASPHTSAGRVPTAQGLRFFVDQLLSIKPINAAVEHEIKHALDASYCPSELCQRASKVLAELSDMTGLVSVPTRDNVKLRQIELMHLSDLRILCVLIEDDGEIKNRIIDVSRRFTSHELQLATQLLNTALVGVDLVEGRQRLSAMLCCVTSGEKDRAKEGIHEIASKVVAVSLTASDDLAPELIYSRGKERLLELPGTNNVNTLRMLINSLHQTGPITNMLARAKGNSGISLFIGEECGSELLRGCSVVAAPYYQHKQAIGSVGIIGSVRMNYRALIPVVDAVARNLTAALNQNIPSPY
ncbi:heat-inducible transcriptional repressor HrcA [Flocculibacter collagenilyticus]|uniref:heat-inducible transcriptional repressor HrcA n=1 Tax=Flocculibacter collagenilyticus TaxID=2744479 RepID=UPI0018F58A55|nr:heat-inducible transcriptional repressor HrcA [Flocculibacter collagenilyticus]